VTCPNGFGACDDSEVMTLVLLLMAALLALTAVAFGGAPVQAHGDAQPAALDRRLPAASLVMYGLFLIATDLQWAGWAFAGVLLVFVLLLRPRALIQPDWRLRLVFVLMFIDLRLLAGLGLVREVMQGLGLDQPVHLSAASIGTSPIINHVPASIALAA
jgi:hypothetical protein